MRDHIYGDFVVVEVKDGFRCDLRHRLWGGLAWRRSASGGVGRLELELGLFVVNRLYLVSFDLLKYILFSQFYCSLVLFVAV